jgi:hypothetical protein
MAVEEPVVSGRRQPYRQTAVALTRRVADPLGPNDNGANCLRRGYLIEPARERRGLLTCSACG